MNTKDKTLNIPTILNIFKKNIGLITLSTIAIGVIGTSYASFIATPKYTASSQLIAKISNNAGSALAGEVQATNQMSTTLAQVLVSPTIIKDAKSELNSSKSINQIKEELSVTSSSTSQVVTLSVKDTNAYDAANMANAISKSFIKKAPSLMNVSNVSILADANPNTNPTSPNKKLIIFGSIIGGLTIGVLISLIKELFNTKIQKSEDIDEFNINFLGGVNKTK